MASATAYDHLGVAPSTDGAALKRAYHAACLQWHPDKHRQSSPEALARANTMFKRVTAAYEVLSDPEARAALDLRIQMDKIRARAAANVSASRDAAAAATSAMGGAGNAGVGSEFVDGAGYGAYDRPFVDPDPLSSADEIINDAVREAHRCYGSRAASAAADGLRAANDAVSDAVRAAASQVRRQAYAAATGGDYAQGQDDTDLDDIDDIIDEAVRLISLSHAHLASRYPIDHLSPHSMQVRGTSSLDDIVRDQARGYGGGAQAFSAEAAYGGAAYEAEDEDERMRPPFPRRWASASSHVFTAA
jgi:curved DNA-binding protein CbpA